jgi:PAS domain S-box-containing protein
MTIRLEHVSKVFGWLTVSIPKELVEEESEQELFEEVGSDIAFALHDIDREEKHREGKKKIIESEEKYRNLVNDMREMIGKIEANGEIIYASPQTFELMGFRPEEVIGKNWFKSYVHPEDITQIAKAIKSSNDSEGSFQSFDFRMRHKDGHYVHISGRGKMIKEKGKIRYIASFRDITKRTLAEQKLRESENLYHMAYDRANFYKDLFAHDMNNILQAILSGLQLSEIIFDDPKKLEDLKNNLRIMKNQIIRGATLISNVRKLSQLEEIEMSLKKIEICNIFKNLISTLKNTHKTKNLNIQVPSIGKKLHVQADDFLVDVFENILINSIRHNRNPSVEITVRISRAQKNSVNYLKMEFQDNGKGIPNTRKETIFQRGYTEKKSVHGTGLGLSLVKRIIKSYNGEIWVEDRIKGDHLKGSNFILLIPEVN